MSAPNEFQLVVIGGGGAGLPAALAASESGLTRVLVLEKRASAGGNAARAWGLFAADSPLQKEEMAEARKETLFKLIMDWSRWKTDPAIWRAFIWKSGDTIAWLEQKGLKFNLVRYFPGQEPPVWHVPEGRGARLVQELTENCRRRGVQFHLNTRCQRILLDKDGRVRGVTAEQNGQTISILTRRVIIASGGFAGNHELLRKYCQFYDDSLYCLGLPHDGDGLSMGLEAGAATADLGLLLLEWPHVQGDSASVLATLSREPYTLYLNKEGRRFIDEAKGLHAFECANAVLRQPQKCGYILADSEMIAKMERSGAVLGRGNNRMERRRNMPGLTEQLQNLADKNAENLLISRAWDEIARWIGAETDILKKTIEKYNHDCEQGCDSAYFKDARYLWPLVKPPFYAIKGQLVFLNTLGGLKINERMEVLKQNGEPIPGLYAAGADTGGWEPDTYCDRLSGTALGFAVNSGRIAGENAARTAGDDENRK